MENVHGIYSIYTTFTFQTQKNCFIYSIYTWFILTLYFGEYILSKQKVYSIYTRQNILDISMIYTWYILDKYMWAEGCHDGE